MGQPYLIARMLPDNADDAGMARTDDVVPWDTAAGTQSVASEIHEACCEALPMHTAIALESAMPQSD
jgi:hypothetical protein